MAYEFEIGRELITTIITILVTGFFINWAAKLVIDRGSFLAAILTAIIGSILAILALAFVGSLTDNIWLGRASAIATWALVAAIFYRTAWLKGAIIGLVAWVLWFLINLLIDFIMSAI